MFQHRRALLFFSLDNPAVLSFSHAFLLVRVLRIGLRVVRGSGILLQAVASGVELGTLPVGAVPSPVPRWQYQNIQIWIKCQNIICIFVFKKIKNFTLPNNKKPGQRAQKSPSGEGRSERGEVVELLL